MLKVSLGTQPSKVVQDLQDGGVGGGLALAAEGTVPAVLVGQPGETLPR